MKQYASTHALSMLLQIVYLHWISPRRLERICKLFLPYSCNLYTILAHVYTNGYINEARRTCTCKREKSTIEPINRSRMLYFRLIDHGPPTDSRFLECMQAVAKQHLHCIAVVHQGNCTGFSESLPNTGRAPCTHVISCKQQPTETLI